MSYLFRYSDISIYSMLYDEAQIIDYLRGAYAFSLIHRLRIFEVNSNVYIVDVVICICCYYLYLCDML